MKSFAATTSIRATPEKIWSILTDAARYPRWNTTVTKVDGRIAPGERVTVHVTINPGRAFPVTVAEFEAPRRMVWRGGMPLGLFTGERTFTLTPQRDGTVTFDMRETYRGLLASLIGRSIPDLQPAFDEFARALTREAERE
jgi:uncharacterized protein YndB with AHSA1/START domain